LHDEEISYHLSAKDKLVICVSVVVQPAWTCCPLSANMNFI